MTRLTTEERDLLVTTRANLASDHLAGPAMTTMTKDLADGLRRAIPELDDLNLARVLVQVAGLLTAMWAQVPGEPSWADMSPRMTLAYVSTVFASAAVELASTELEFPEADAARSDG